MTEKIYPANQTAKLCAALFGLFLVIIVFMANWDIGTGFFDFFASVPGADKTGHLVLMGIFSFLVNMTLSASRLRIGPLRILKGTLIVVVIVTAEELSQTFIPSRTCSLSDLCFDYLGIVSFGWIASVLHAKICCSREK